MIRLMAEPMAMACIMPQTLTLVSVTPTDTAEEVDGP